VELNKNVDTNQTPLLDDKATEDQEAEAQPEAMETSEESQEETHENSREDSDESKSDETESPEKRFYSWEGGDVQKRYNYNRIGLRIRAKRFYSWEGHEEGKRSDRNVEAAKRKFYQWAGKRSGIQHPIALDTINRAIKRYKASRSFRDEKMSPFSAEEKRKFYQWAGKRSDPTSDEGVDSAEYWIDAEAPGEIKRGAVHQYRSFRPVRPQGSRFSKRKFYSWAGKRSGAPMNEKRKFYSWSG